MAEQIEKLNPDYDIETAVSEGSYEKVQTYIDDKVRYFQDLVLTQEPEKLKKALEYEYRLCDWLIQKYTYEKSISYFLGYYVGLLASFKNELTVAYNQKQISLISEINVPHLDDILFAIEEHEGIRHGKLAEYIGIERSTLTGIMDRIVASGAVTFSRPGKYKFYYLTDEGKEYCNKNRRYYQSEKSINVLVAELIEQLQRDSNPSQTIGKIVQTIFEHRANTVPLLHENNSRNKTTDLIRILSDEKPQFRFLGDPDKNSYQLENVFAIYDRRNEKSELVLKTRIISKKGYALFPNKQEA